MTSRRLRTRTGTLAAVVILALLVPVLSMEAAALDPSDRTIPVVTQGTTDWFGGGAEIRVTSGEAQFAVVYGTEGHPNGVTIVSEFTRYLGGADFVDEQGNLIARRGVPIVTIFGQTFDRLVEFRDVDGDGLFDFRRVDLADVGGDVPLKALNLRTAWVLESPPTIEVAANATYVNFTLSVRDLVYTHVWDREGQLARPGVRSDGVLDYLAFAFHLKVTVSDLEAQVPWYRVTVSGRDERHVDSVAFAGWRTVSGQSVAMGAKYDHTIAGWDFDGPSSRLALENHATYGNLLPRPVTRFVHTAPAELRNNDSFDYRENGTWTDGPVRPRLAPVAKDSIYLDDEWYRLGRLSWASEVVVDGVTMPMGMTFQVHGGAPFTFEVHGDTFVGFRLLAAFIYPAGQTIFHDPGFDAFALLLGLPSVANATPFTVVALQLAVVGLALVPAFALRSRIGRSSRAHPPRKGSNGPEEDAGLPKGDSSVENQRTA